MLLTLALSPLLDELGLPEPGVAALATSYKSTSSKSLGQADNATNISTFIVLVSSRNVLYGYKMRFYKGCYSDVSVTNPAKLSLYLVYNLHVVACRRVCSVEVKVEVRFHSGVGRDAEIVVLLSSW